MKRIPVESSCLDEIGYDEQTKTLEVRMTIGRRVYRYKNVSLSEFTRLMEADSKGKFFNAITKTHEYEIVQE